MVHVFKDKLSRMQNKLHRVSTDSHGVVILHIALSVAEKHCESKISEAKLCVNSAKHCVTFLGREII